MIPRFQTLSALCCSLLMLGATASVASAQLTTSPGKSGSAGKKAEVGEPAPDFTLEDSNGQSHHLADHKGKVVILQWINPDCPVCKACASSGKVTRMLKEVAAIDRNAEYLTINSTHYMEAKKSGDYLKSYKIDAPALIDTDGTVGKLYGARTTPHVFVIDGKGILRYNGAFDDDKKGKKGDEATNYVVNAVRQIAAGETVSPDKTKPYGCSVKYAKAKKSG